MKTCPTCNRTYDDETMNFCLDDGSTLSQPYDPDRARSLPPTMLPGPAPTELFNPGSMPESGVTLIPTIQSLQPPPLYSATPQAPQTKKESSKGWMWIALGILILGAGVVLGLIWLTQGRESNSQPGTNVINTNSTPTATPNATAQDSWNERNERASLSGENLTYYPGTTPEQCQSDCAKNQKCKGFTFIRTGAYNASDPAMCYQLSRVTEATSHSCCISAVKR
jgi:hypothetical protein